MPGCDASGRRIAPSGWYFQLNVSETMGFPTWRDGDEPATGRIMIPRERERHFTRARFSRRRRDKSIKLTWESSAFSLILAVIAIVQVVCVCETNIDTRLLIWNTLTFRYTRRRRRNFFLEIHIRGNISIYSSNVSATRQSEHRTLILVIFGFPFSCVAYIQYICIWMKLVSISRCQKYILNSKLLD